MPIADILSLTATDPVDGPAIELAKVIAKATSSRLNIILPLFLRDALPYEGHTFSPPGTIEPSREEIERAQKREAALAQSFKDSGISGQCNLERTLPRDLGRLMCHCAWTNDLVVIDAQKPREFAGLSDSFFSELLFGSGRPILVVPQHNKLNHMPKTVAVAWKPCRESTRALHDMIDLFGNDIDISIFMVGDISGGLFDRGEPGPQILDHLTRHGTRAKLIALKNEAQSVGNTLRNAVLEHHCEMLVMGGYGHSRLREWVLGGATSDIFENMPIPTLYAH